MGRKRAATCLASRTSQRSLSEQSEHQGLPRLHLRQMSARSRTADLDYPCLSNVFLGQFLHQRNRKVTRWKIREVQLEHRHQFFSGSILSPTGNYPRAMPDKAEDDVIDRLAKLQRSVADTGVLDSSHLLLDPCPTCNPETAHL